MIAVAKDEEGLRHTRGGLRTLVIHPALAPYRIDLFNAVGAKVDLEVVFQRGRVSYHQDLDQTRLQSALRVPHERLAGNWVVFKRDIPVGVSALIRQRSPAVVVTTEFSLVSMFVNFLRGQKKGLGQVIWTSENVDFLASHGSVRLGLRRFLARRADALLLYSDEVADAFAVRCSVNRSKMHVCANHQDESVIRARLQSAGAVAEKLLGEHQLRGKRVVLYVGRLAKEKNLGTLLGAWATIVKDVPDLLLAIVGTGPEGDSLRKSAAQLRISDRVKFVGHQEGKKLSAWYRISSLFVLPSLFEPYGAVVNEALICGVPVLCSKSCGARVLISEDENGAVFPVDDSMALETKIRRWISRFSAADVLIDSNRLNLMPIPFQREVDGFLAALRQAARSARSATEVT